MNLNIYPKYHPSLEIIAKLVSPLNDILPKRGFKINLFWKGTRKIKNMINGTAPDKKDIHSIMTKCNKPRCKCCTHVNNGNMITSTRTGSSYLIKSDKETCSCDTSEAIYLITCSECKIQYIGETGNTLRTRLTGHRSTINTQKDLPVARHFNEHESQGLEITLLEKSDHTSNEESRKKREQHWIFQFMTDHPYGLNEKLSL
jgi:hypothetical protein